MKLLAHITDINGECIEQTLYDHSIHTAEYAAESLKNTGVVRQINRCPKLQIKTDFLILAIA